MKSAKYKRVSPKTGTTTSLIKTGAGVLKGIIISSNTSGTIKLWDNTSAATTVLVDTMTIASGERYIPFFDATFDTGLYGTFGGTSELTIIFS